MREYSSINVMVISIKVVILTVSGKKCQCFAKVLNMLLIISQMQSKITNSNLCNVVLSS